MRLVFIFIATILSSTAFSNTGVMRVGEMPLLMLSTNSDTVIDQTAKKTTGSKAHDPVGYCELLYPGEIDNINRRCVDRTRYAVLYDGRILDNSCFRSLDEAYNKMDRSAICEFRPPANVSYCGIMGPGEVDDSQRRCMDGNFYSVHYDGHILDGRCYATADEALERAERTRICQRRSPLRVGRCRLLNPNQTDRKSVRCMNRDFYAFTYRGDLVGNRCFATADEAFRSMRRNSLCNRRR